MGLSKSVEVFDEGGFSSAVLPHDGYEFAVLHGQRDAFEGFYAAGIGEVNIFNYRALVSHRLQQHLCQLIRRQRCYVAQVERPSFLSIS